MQTDFGPEFLTNEEKRAPVYSAHERPTLASSVTSDTPLSELNLNWREKELPEKERTKHVHRLHPYLGKYIPQLVEIFLRKYFHKGQIVLDPFCGSGTTLVQANELGINSIGYDVSAFNVLLCRVKTAEYDLIKARKEVLDILEKVRLATQKDNGNLSFWDAPRGEVAGSTEENQYLKKWFAPEALNELITYRNLIDNYHYQELLKVILSRSARSARLTTHFDLDFPKAPQTESYYCYKHSRECAPTTNAYQFLKRYSLDSLKRIEEFSAKRTKATVEIHHCDSRAGEFPVIDGVITSPPYVGLIDYHEQHAYAYHLLSLKDQREKEIGAATNGSSQRARKLYQEDIAGVFRKLGEKLRPGGRMIVVAGDKANLYPEIANLAGVEVEATVLRHVNRRTGRRSGEFYESVFIWRKPTT
ncbi:MAG TPA: DNA methyltransferase [Pyrinomonadaceae bacterium]|nr:DNA methyltransferase [Pyrinomonadaceae bacterium]